MARDFTIYGEILVKVRGNGALANLGGDAQTHELGLSVDPIQIFPKWRHQDIHVDDLGPDVPANVAQMPSEAIVRMNLIHFDGEILAACIMNAMGVTAAFGTVCAAGTLMDGGVDYQDPGDNFISLNLVPGDPDAPAGFRFPRSYLLAPPLEIPLSTEKSIVRLEWRVIPFVPLEFDKGGSTNGLIKRGQEITSKGLVLWDSNLDADSPMGM